MSVEIDRPTVFPVLRYRDARAAIRWLTAVLGFTEDYVVPGDGDTVAHAQLGWPGGTIMLGSTPDPDGPFPFQVGPSCVYLVVDDPDARHDKAVAAGAEVVMPLTDQEYGSREFSVRDPERNLWSLGTYQP